MHTDLLKPIAPRPPCRSWLAAAFFAFTAWSAAAVTITNVSVVNLTPTGFDVIWRAERSTPSIAVFADAGGLTNLAGQLGTEPFPLNTGSPSLAAGYDRRLGQQVTRQKTQNFGLAMVRVTGCRPGTAYYYRLTSTPASGGSAVYPASGPLPSVTTPQENTFVVNDQSLILEVPLLDAEGRIVTLSHSNAVVSLAAVVGDGANTNQAFFHLNDLFALAGGGNFGALGPQEFTLGVLGANQAELIQKVTINFAPDFAVGQGTTTTVGTEFLAVYVGSSIVRAGQSVSVPINANTSANLGGVDLLLDIPDGHLGGLLLQSLAAEIDPLASSVTPQGGNTWLVRLRARAGQYLTGVKTMAQLTGTALAGQISSFVPLRVTGFSATHTDASAVKNLLALSGRVVVIGSQPLLEAWRDSVGGRLLTFYGIPGVPYAVEHTAALEHSVWDEFNHFVASSLATTFAVSAAAAGDFYRGREFNPDPPVLDIALLPDGSRQLTIYGLPGLQCEVESTPSLGSPWQSMSRLQLSTNGLAFISLPAAGFDNSFYRVLPVPPADTLEMDAKVLADGSRQLTIHGPPGTLCEVDATPSLGSPWQLVTRLQLANNGLAFLTLPATGSDNLFYRVLPVPPVDSLDLDATALADGSRRIVVTGSPGTACSIQSAAGLGAAWQELMHLQLTNGTVTFILPRPAQPDVFYRAVRYAPEPPVLDVIQTADGRRHVTLFGQPWTSYAIEYASSLGSAWHQWAHFPLTNGVAYLTLPELGPEGAFYRASRFAPDPPVVDPLRAADGSPRLLGYGLPGSSYTVLSANSVSPPATWTPVLNYTLTNTFQHVTPPGGGAALFYRLRRN